MGVNTVPPNSDSNADSNSTLPEDERMRPEQKDELTSNAATRWEWLATAVVAATVFTFLLIVSLAVLGVVTLSSLPQAWFILFGSVVAGSYAYAIGKEYVNWRGKRG